MGTLTPGAEYIYESPDNGKTVYAREKGSSRKILVGKYYPSNNIEANLKEDQLWREIRENALTNESLQKILANAILVHQLSKESTDD